MSGGSVQLRAFRCAIRAGLSLEAACTQSRISLTEGRLILRDDARQPPSPECFEPLPSTTMKGPEMAKDDEGATGGEYARPDAAKAFEIYDNQIAPKLAHMNTLKGDLSQPYDDIKQHAHFPRKVLNFIIALEGEEDAKRDHLLLALSEGLRHRQLFLPRDLVTMAAGQAGHDVIPTGDGDDDATDLDDDDAADDGLIAKDATILTNKPAAKPAPATH